jgi:hypothetical protein
LPQHDRDRIELRIPSERRAQAGAQHELVLEKVLAALSLLVLAIMLLAIMLAACCLLIIVPYLIM